MTKHIVWAVIACVLVVALASLNPGGIGVPLGSIALVLLMFGCCVLPMLMVVLSGRSGEKGGCCEKETKTETKDEEKREVHAQPKAGCH